MSTPRYVVIANPDGKRWQAFLRDLLMFWEPRGVTPDVRMIPWRDVIIRDGNLHDFDGLDEPALVRVESPGRDEEVTRLLLEAGEQGEIDWRTIEMPRGWLASPATYFRGFVRTLIGIDQSLLIRPHLHQTTHCPDVVTMFDKNATCERLHTANIPVPEFDRYGDLVHFASGRPVTFVKLVSGSSASGIIALHGTNSNAMWGIGSMIEIDGRWFNTRRLQHLEGPMLQRALEFLISQGVCVQHGIPPAQIDGMNFDVRVIVIHGRIAFTIFRLSPHPMTNLHLGGRRGDWKRCRATIPNRVWLDAMDHCVEAAGCFRADMVGIDLIFERNYLSHYILEVNAFGDFFPDWTDEAGRTVHQVQIEESARRQGWIA